MTKITSKTPRQLSAIKFHLQREGATYESHLDGEIQVVKYEIDSKPIAVIFRNKKKDPVGHYRYSSHERREESIQSYIDSEKSHQQYKEERKKLAKQKIDLKVGDILYTSWGYEQTNITFYKVTKLVGKSTAEYVKIGSKQVEITGPSSADVSPDPSYIGDETFRGRISRYGVKVDDVRGHASKTNLTETHHSSWGY